jgi:hypothetical protein
MHKLEDQKAVIDKSIARNRKGNWKMSKQDLSNVALLLVVATPAPRGAGRFEARLGGDDRVLCVSRTPFFDAARKLLAPPDHVFVITAGGIESVAPNTATKAGDIITFGFNPPVCAGGSPERLPKSRRPRRRPMTRQSSLRRRNARCGCSRPDCRRAQK